MTHSATAPRIAMTAAPRNGGIQSRCNASIARAGFGELLVSAEPGTDVDMFAGATVCQNTTRLGQWQNFLWTLDRALQRWPHMDCFTFVEDDVVFCRNVGPLVARLQWPSERCGCVQLYSSAAYTGYPRGLCRLRQEHALDMLGACALLLRRDAAQDLVRWGQEKGWRGHTSGILEASQEKEAADTFVGEVLTFRGWEIWICNPSLGQHIGEPSTLPHHVGQVSRRLGLNWPGEDADALELFAKEVL